jgi:hypothetical protein
MTTITMEQEINPWEAQRARFETAAHKLNLDPGLMKVLSLPNRDHRPHPGADGQWRPGSVHRIPRAAFGGWPTLVAPGFTPECILHSNPEHLQSLTARGTR